jgi:hypothetical protein
MNDVVETEFQTAVGVAREALARFNQEPLVASKRGGPRLSPWWRVYVQASEVAQRWHRQREDKRPRSIDEELDQLLGDGELDRLIDDATG